MRAQGKSQLEMVHELLKRATDTAERDKLSAYRPWPKQIEFHNAGINHRERLLRAINQVGKSYAGAAETAMHLTGRYSDNWGGRRFDTKTTGWVVSQDWSFSKNNAQRLLMGETREQWGTGLIPGDCILDYTLNSHASSETLESVIVKSRWGGKSRLLFKSADVEQNKLGGDTIHFAWVDEETKYGHYEEIMIRISVHKGIVYTTFTPLAGATEVVNRFILDRLEGTHDTRWTIDDDNHFSLEERESKKRQFANSPDKSARLYADPSQGSGNVFTAPREHVQVTPFDIPDHWPRICGHDIGWTHPASLCWWAIDRDTDTSYLYRAWGQSGAKPEVIYDQWANHGGPQAGKWIPVAWPGDGDNETAAGGGVPVANQLRDLGMLMLGEPAMYPETGAKEEKTQGRKSVEAQAQEMDSLMHKGRIKVFSTCEAFWHEYGLYHRDKNGKIVKKLDDVISGARYGWVMRRYAATRTQARDIASAIAGLPQNWRS